ncbi:hypothetical protein DSECCO2_120320 [anaerobic digester metagenome]
MILPRHTRALPKLRFNQQDSKTWINEFNKYTDYEKEEILSYLEKFQGTYIRYAMANFINPIQLPNLGQFYYKEARKEFYDIKNANPDMPIEQVVAKVKENYWDAKNKDLDIRTATNIEKGKKVKARKNKFVSVSWSIKK